MKLEFFPYKIVESNEKKFLYTINSSAIYEIDDDLIDVLECEGKESEAAFEILKYKMSYEKFATLVNDMIDAGLINNIKTSNPPVKENLNRSLSSITLMLAQECNLRCVYCYGNGGVYGDRGVMDLETAINAVNYLIRVSREDKLYIVFFGGEPLLKFDVIKKVVLYCKRKEAEIGKKFYFSITTNGTLINEEIEQFLIENKFAVQISIDGTKEKHDANRYDANHKGCYDNVLKKTSGLRKKYVISARATASKNNLDYVEIFEHLYSLGFARITIAAAQNVLDERSFKTLLKEYKRYIWYFYSLVKRGDFSKACTMNDIIMPLRKFEYGSERTLSCGVVRTMCAVDISGTIFPCHRFVSSKECSIGDVTVGMTVGASEFLNRTKVNNHRQCERCWAKNLCLGGCPNENYENTGNITISSNRTCEFNRMLFGELLKVYVNLTSKEKEKIFSINPNI